jgi:hypothetical protein
MEGLVWRLAFGGIAAGAAGSVGRIMEPIVGSESLHQKVRVFGGMLSTVSGFICTGL